MQHNEIDLGIRAGLELFEKATLPYSDGMFFLKMLLLQINSGQIGLMPMQKNAEGNMVPAPTQAPVQTPFGPGEHRKPPSDD